LRWSPSVTLRVESPTVRVPQKAPRLSSSTALKQARSLRGIDVTLVVTNATIEAGGRRIGGIDLDSRLAWERASQRLSLRTRAQSPSQSHFALDGTMREDHVDFEVRELVLTPDDLRGFLPAGTPPPTKVTGHLHARGPLTALRVEGTLKPGDGTVRLRSTVDVRHRRGEAVVALDEVEPAFVSGDAPIVLSGQLEARFNPTDAQLTLRGHYRHHEIDPWLPASATRWAPVGPGGAFDGTGSLRFTDGVDGEFAIRVMDAGKSRRLVAGPMTTPSTPATLVLGRYTKRPHQAATLRVRTLERNAGAARSGD
jgi:hypothetical protein